MTTAPQDTIATIQWTTSPANGTPLVHEARWHCERGSAAPKKVVLADDTMNADQAYRLACEGTALMWRGDFQNARQLLQALARRLDKTAEKTARQSSEQRGAAAKAAAKALAANAGTPVDPALHFHRHRQVQAQRARVLSMLLVEMDAKYLLTLRRAPNVQEACTQAWGAGKGSMSNVVSLRELQGLIGAFEWRKKGVEIAALLALRPTGYAHIHPHYGVYSPVRGEYIDLVAQAPLPAALNKQSLAFDIGTGTGVLAAVLARRGVKQVVGTDTDERALACAKDNLPRLGVDQQVKLQKADLFPEGRASLLLCNPPWLPAKASAPVERAVYDEGSRMLQGFLQGAAAHLLPGGEAWLILSDLAEHLGLRSREQLMAWIDSAGLRVLERHDIRPRHPKAQDESNPLHRARAAEVTSLWRLAAV